MFRARFSSGAPATPDDHQRSVFPQNDQIGIEVSLFDLLVGESAKEGCKVGEGGLSCHHKSRDGESRARSGAGEVFVGSSEHNLDAKGRLVLPAKFRDALEGRGYLTYSTDQVLQLWPFAEFDRQMKLMAPKVETSAEDRRLFRLASSYTFEVEIEPSQGRIAIPSKLREVANLKSGRPVVIAGSFNCIELWSKPDFDRRVLLLDEPQGGTSA